MKTLFCNISIAILLLWLPILSKAQSDPIFVKYPWLEGIVETGILCQGEIITEYDLGPFAFIDIQRGIDQFFYFEDGTLFCQGTTGFDCVEAYGLNSTQVGLTFLCPAPPIGTGPCGLGCQFPWLENLLDFDNCSDGSVEVYQRGIHKFLNVNDGVSSRFYYQDGTVYCTNSSNNNCSSLYGFTPADIVEDFQCESSAEYCIGDSTLIGVYTLDYIQYGPCPFWDQSTIDLRGLGTNCYTDNGIERCLNGTIVIGVNETFDFNYSESGPAPGGGISISGGSGAGTLIKEGDGTEYFCYGTDCKPTDFFANGNRVEFDLELEGCPVRVGGYR